MINIYNIIIVLNIIHMQSDVIMYLSNMNNLMQKKDYAHINSKVG